MANSFLKGSGLSASRNAEQAANAWSLGHCETRGDEAISQPVNGKKNSNEPKNHWKNLGKV
jgi:hypothetical protein